MRRSHARGRHQHSSRNSAVRFNQRGMPRYRIRERETELENHDPSQVQSMEARLIDTNDHGGLQNTLRKGTGSSRSMGRKLIRRRRTWNSKHRCEDSGPSARGQTVYLARQTEILGKERMAYPKRRFVGKHDNPTATCTLYACRGTFLGRVG
jgi:hypothetical protein